MQPAAPLFASALSAPLASPDEDSWSYLAASLPPRPRPQSFGHFVPRSRSLSRRSSRNSEMEVNEESGADLKLKEEEEEEEPGFNGPGFPPPSEAQPDPSTTALAALANTFPPGLWNPPGHGHGHEQSFGLGESNPGAMANGHHQFSSFLGMLSAAAVPAAYGGAPSGFMDCGAGFGGLSGSSLGAMMDHPFPGNRHLDGFENGGEPSREIDGCKDASNSELSKPECSGGAGQDDRPSASCPKKRKRPGQDRGAKHAQEGSQQLPTVVAKQEKDDDGDAEKSEPKRPVVPSRKPRKTLTHRSKITFI